MIKHLPNLLTVTRIVISFLLLYFYMESERITLLIVFLFMVASVTDKLDGDLARKYNVISKIGKILDPIADKLLLVFVLFILAIEELLPVWGLIFVVVKEGLITLYRLDKFRRGVVLSASKLGKKKVTYNFLVVAIVFLICSLGYENVLGENKVLKWWILTILI